MAITLKIDPVTRLEGHLKIQVTVDSTSGTQQVVDAKATGTLFRGFEAILKNRNPMDASDITQRICGVCPVSHGLAASMTLEAAANFTPPDNARIMRNLVLGSNFLQSHILHFYHLALPDFVDGPAAIPPWTPAWSSDKRLSATEAATLQGHYVTALEMRRKAHEMGAIFGGRLPHPPTFVPGGFTTTPRAARITQFRTYLAELTNFISAVYIPDAQQLAFRYSDYYGIGKGHGNLLAYGVFDLDPTGALKLLKRGRIQQGSASVQSLDPDAITEQVTYSWYADSTNNLKPTSGSTQPQYPKGEAYSWLKAPRYGATTRKGGKKNTGTVAAYEVGPLARMFVNGDYNNGISVLDRHIARAQETLKVAKAMLDWVGQINPSGPVYQPFATPASGSGYGLTEAPRGALGHWTQITSGKTANYQVVTPTCWNASPRDTAGVRGPLEQALIGTPVLSVDEPVEVLRVIHSFDPCLSCAVHVMRPAEGRKVFALGHYHSESEAHEHGHFL